MISFLRDGSPLLEIFQPDSNRTGSENRRSNLQRNLGHPPCDPCSVTVDGETEQAAAGGAPAQVSATVPLNPPTGVTFSVKVALCPAGIAAEVGEGESAKSPIGVMELIFATNMLPQG
jgi:hypothetical protein